MNDPQVGKIEDTSLELNDELIQPFLYMAELGAGMGFTISTSGLVVTGQLVSRSVYLRRFASELREAMGDKNSQIVLGGLVEFLEGRASRDEAEIALLTKQFEEAQAEGKENETKEAPTYSYVHLIDAVLYAGDKEINVSVWRCLTSSVDGFTMGLSA